MTASHPGVTIHRHFADHPGAQTPQDPLMPTYWERVLNGLALRRRSGQVYDLYFPEEVHGASLRLFDSVGQAFLPAVPPQDADRNVCATFLTTLRQLFETLHDATHPLRLALDQLSTLETVRIIEGKA